MNSVSPSRSSSPELGTPSFLVCTNGAMVFADGQIDYPAFTSPLSRFTGHIEEMHAVYAAGRFLRSLILLNRFEEVARGEGFEPAPPHFTATHHPVWVDKPLQNCRTVLPDPALYDGFARRSQQVWGTPNSAGLWEFGQPILELAYNQKGIHVQVRTLGVASSYRMSGIFDNAGNEDTKMEPVWAALRDRDMSAAMVEAVLTDPAEFALRETKFRRADLAARVRSAFRGYRFTGRTREQLQTLVAGLVPRSSVFPTTLPNATRWQTGENVPSVYGVHAILEFQPENGAVLARSVADQIFAALPTAPKPWQVMVHPIAKSSTEYLLSVGFRDAPWETFWPILHDNLFYDQTVPYQDGLVFTQP